MRHGILAVLVLFSGLTVHALPQTQEKVSFPGPRAESRSTNGYYVIRNVDQDNVPFTHKLFFRNEHAKEEFLLMEYGRHIETLWSPSGHNLVVNDHAGSDYSEIYVYEFKPNFRSIKLSEQIREKFESDASIVKNHHVYMDAVEWLSDTQLKIKASGYGEADPKGFKRWFTYTLGGKLERVTMTPAEQKADEESEKRELIARCKTRIVKNDLPPQRNDWHWGDDEKYRGAPVISYTIQEDGSVIDLKLQRSSGVKGIDKYALQTVKGWKYRAMPGCPGVDTTVTLIIDFQGKD